MWSEHDVEVGWHLEFLPGDRLMSLHHERQYITRKRTRPIERAFGIARCRGPPVAPSERHSIAVRLLKRQNRSRVRAIIQRRRTAPVSVSFVLRGSKTI